MHTNLLSNNANALSSKPADVTKPLLFGPLILLGLIVANLCLGAESISLIELWQIISGADTTSVNQQIFWNLRLPRTLLAMLVGCHFALAGLILQYSLRNPLADPSVLGISSGASLAVLVSLFFSAQLLIHPLALPLMALLGGSAACAMILLLSARSGFQPLVVILYGVALSAVFNALVMWVVVKQGHGETELAVLWLAGALYGRDFTHLAMLIPWTLIGMLCLPLLSKPLLLMRNSDDIASACGLALKKWRLLAITLAILFATSAVSVCGPVAFVGLIMPHLARFLMASSTQLLIPMNLFCGASLLLLADLLGRIAVPPQELPVGAMSAVIGVPVFIFVLQRLGSKH